MNAQPPDTTGVVLKAVPSPVELVENAHVGLIPGTAFGSRLVSARCVRVFATSWPYAGHSPPVVAVVHRAAAAAAVDDAPLVATIASPATRAATRTDVIMPLLR